MRGRKRIAALISVILICAMLIDPVLPVKAQESDNAGVNYNIEVVVDGSGSLKRTDSEKNRFTAIDIFLQTLRENGNNVGAVVFTSKVVVDTGLSAMDSKNDKDNLSNQIKSYEVSNGYTNIGLALETAVDNLENAGNDLQNIILLISDGNTDLSSSDKIEASLQKEAMAVERCISSDIKVYGICLNHDDTANLDEFTTICDKTEGAFIEVKSSKNLVQALRDFYAQIFKTKYVTDVREIGSDGTVTKAIEVPAYGVEEINVTVDNASEIESILITKPSGVELSKNEFEGLSSKIDDFYFMKITEPDAGVWKVTVEGDPGTEITFDYVFNTDNKVIIQTNSSDNAFSPGEEIEITAAFSEDGVELSGAEYYEGYNATLVVNFSETENENLQYYPMDEDGESGYKTTLSYDQEGMYDIYAVLSCGEFESLSDTLGISIGNKLPVFNSGSEEIITIKLKKLFSNSGEIELADYFTDEEDSELTYELLAPSYASDEIALDGSVVTLSNLVDGKFTIEAEDSNGGIAKGTFQVEVQNLLFVIIGIIVAVLLIIIAIVVLNIMKANRRFFDGYLNVFSNGDVDDSNSRPIAAFKKQVNLAEFCLQGHQFGNDVWFKVMKDNSVKGDGSHKLQMVSSKPFYYQGPDGEQKLTKLDMTLNMSYDVRSHSSEDFDAVDDSICISLDAM